MLAGNFQTIDLAEVVRLLSVSAQSGVLFIRQGEQESALGFQFGQLVDARAGELSGLDALALMASTVDGEFAFEVGGQAAGQSLASYPTDQLIQGLRHEIAERRSLVAAMPMPGAVLRYVAGGVQSGFHATADELGLLLLADGRRTVREIAAAAKRDLVGVQAALAQFRLAGVLEEVGEEAPPPPGGAPQFWRGKRIG